MARPTKFTPQRVETILAALRAGNTRTAAAGYAEIDHVTLANWMKRYSHFSQAVEKAESDAEVRHVANIAKASNEGNWTASAWWLERRRHAEWGRKDRLDVVQTVRVLAAQHHLSEEETAEAVAEAERFLKETRGAAPR